MSCCCEDGLCFARRIDADGTFVWAETGAQTVGSRADHVAIDGSGNVYINGRGGITALDSDGAFLWRTSATQFNRRILTALAIDADWVYVAVDHEAAGAFTPGYSGANFFRLDIADGTTDESRTKGGLSVAAHDAAADGSGGAYFATSEGVFHFDSDFDALTDVGCSSAAQAVAVDADDNLYVAGDPGCSLESLDAGCPFLANVRKYNSAGVLQNGATRLASPVTLAVDAARVYIGHHPPEEDHCNLQAWDKATFECLWEKTLPTVRDLAVSGDGLYVVAGGYLYLLNASTGAKMIWCRKYEGEDGEENPVAGTPRGVAANEDFSVVVGTGIPCNSSDDEACDSPAACDECACECCECGTTGPFGGYIVGNDGTSDCGCAEVPCVGYVRSTWDGCLSGWPEEVRVDRFGDDEVIWSGGFVWDCGGNKNVTFVITHDCETGWDMVVQINGVARGTVSDIEPNCEGEDGHPGFTSTYTLTGEQADEAGLDCCGDGGGGCVGFGEPCEGGVLTDCCTEPLPPTLYATITCKAGPVDCSCIGSAVIELTASSGGTAPPWIGSATICGRTWELSFACFSGTWGLNLLDCATHTFSTPSSVTCPESGPLSIAFNNISINGNCIGVSPTLTFNVDVVITA